MMSGATRPYAVKTGWLGRGMVAANIMDVGLTLSLPIPLLLRGAKQKDNYFPAEGIIPKDATLEKLISAYRNDEDMKMVMENKIEQQRQSICFQSLPEQFPLRCEESMPSGLRCQKHQSLHRYCCE